MSGFGNLALAAPAVVVFLTGLWLAERILRDREQRTAARPAVVPVVPTVRVLRSVPSEARVSRPASAGASIDAVSTRADSSAPAA